MRPALRSVLRSESPAWPLELSSHRARRTALESFGTAGCNLACKFCIHPDTLIATTQGMRRIADLFESCGKKISHEAGQVGAGIRSVTQDPQQP
jgi:pyruvate-formate lyase-activating enzyme